jgi:S-adenosylmethionine:tRNA ribosyltransferase-isomerase
MHVNDFDYDLPAAYIAQTPAEPRDSSKLMLLNRHSGEIRHQVFRDIVDFLNPGDVLVLNNTRVLPARIPAVKEATGGKAEILLLRQLDATHWRALIGGRRIDTESTLLIPGTNIQVAIEEVLDGSERVIRFSEPIASYLTHVGEMPLPPYIRQVIEDQERYQTVYSRHEGSAAAPTAGLHFTPDLLTTIRDKGVHFAYCTLHIGLDTFKPVQVDKIEDHKIHSEYATLSTIDAKIINDAKLAGGRVIAVGTTSARTLETAAILSAGGDPVSPAASENMCPWRPVIAFEQDTRLFIYPGYRWRVMDGIITNFHLPKSTLVMMMSAFAGRENILNAYETAKQKAYRFYSFGDAMFIHPD